MQKTRIILLALVLLLLASFVSAYDDGDRYLYYGFDIGSGTIAQEKVSNLNGTLNNAGWLSTAAAKVNDSAVDMSAASSIVYNHSITNSYATDYAISIWVYYEKLNGDDKYNILRLDNGINDDENWFHFRIDDRGGQDTTDLFMRGDGINSDVIELSLPTEDVWTHYILNIKASTWAEVYENGVHQGNTTITDAFDGNFCWTIGGVAQTCSETSGGEGDIGAVDNLAFFNKTFTQTEVNAEYNAGAGVYYAGAAPPAPPAVVSSLNLSSPLPANNTQYNTQLLNLNLTANSTYDFNCSLYLDDVLNTTENGFSSGENVGIDFNVTFSATEEATHTFFVECLNGVNETNTSTNTFFVDNVLPNINWFTPANANTTLVNLDSNSVLNTLVQLIDPNIFSYYYNVTYTNGTPVYQFNNTSLTGFSEVNITDQANMSGLVGKFISSVQVCDGHTNNKIKEIKNIEKTQDKIKFADGIEDVEIELEGKSNGQSTSTTKLEDRYKFKFKTKSAKNTETFIVKSNEYIEILHGQTEYPGHLVTGHRWIDFARPNIKHVTVTRISGKQVRVEVELWSPTTEWEFSSIGELNCRQEQRTFNTINVAQDTFSSEVLETSNQTYTLVVNITDLALTSAIGNLTWNGTTYAAVETNDSETINFTSNFILPLINETSKNFTLNWNYNINGNGYTKAENNQTVYQMFIDNCTLGSIVGLNYSIINDTALLPEIANFDVSFDVFITNSSLKRNYTFAFSGASDYQVCVHPNFTNMSFDASGTYQGVGFAAKSYLVTSESISNQTRQIELPLTGGTTPVLFTVVDEVDTAIANVTIQVYTFNPITGTTTLSETVVTDVEGKQFADIVLNDRQYKFILLKDSKIILETQNVIITTTTKRFRVNQNANYFDNYDVVRGITHSLTYTNATKTFSFTWNDPAGTIQDACLRITRQSINSERLLNDTCVSATSGTIVDVIDEDTQDFTYIATSYVKFTDGSELMLNTISVNYNETFKKFGLSGIFVAFLLTLTLVMIGVWHPTISVILMLLGMIVSVILGIYAISWGALVGLIIIGGIVIYKMGK